MMKKIKCGLACGGTFFLFDILETLYKVPCNYASVKESDRSQENEKVGFIFFLFQRPNNFNI